jgi:tRNA (Thr-GGU) A37 N-methylase
VEARFSTPVQTGPGSHPTSYTMGNESLSPGVKRLGRDVDHLYTLWVRSHSVKGQITVRDFVVAEIKRGIFCCRRVQRINR